MPATVRTVPRIILFDGVCNLCSWMLRFVYRNDRKLLYRFAWIQSPEGRELLQWCNLPGDHQDTIVVIENGTAYFKSTAVLRVLRNLRFPWPLFGVGVLLPVALRDWLYDRVAQSRYRLFGRTSECRVPESRLAERFLGRE